MKITVQSKIAELEDRIVALEKAQRVKPTTAERHARVNKPMDVEPEMSGVWTAVDALFKKVFR